MVKRASGNTGDRVVYKADNGEEFFVFVEPNMCIILASYLPLNRLTDPSTPLVEVVQSFDVFSTLQGGGTDGIAGRASLQSLSNAMDVKNMDDAVNYVINHGELRGQQNLGTTDLRARK
ncbi:hypothetical protein BDF22DRAFT_656027 [Syncephalis plumigaleata]|nr:hypothetical protein BDF22DRAFT_656027 [Syncephalis plumigaleata]